jgi:hypothetical protein
MRHLRAYKPAATYKMTLMYFLVNIHINNQPTLYKVNGVVYIKAVLGKPSFHKWKRRNDSKILVEPWEPSLYVALKWSKCMFISKGVSMIL